MIDNPLLKDLRQAQPIEELKRKADKAHRRKTKIWTQEEIDWCVAEGRSLFVMLGWNKCQRPLELTGIADRGRE